MTKLTKRKKLKKKKSENYEQTICTSTRYGQNICEVSKRLAKNCRSCAHKSIVDEWTNGRVTARPTVRQKGQPKGDDAQHQMPAACPTVHRYFKRRTCWKTRPKMKTNLKLWTKQNHEVKRSQLILLLLNPDISCLLIWIRTVCHSVHEYVSTTWIKSSDWLTIRNGHDILIYSAWQGLKAPTT